MTEKYGLFRPLGIGNGYGGSETNSEGFPLPRIGSTPLQMLQAGSFGTLKEAQTHIEESKSFPSGEGYIILHYWEYTKPRSS